MTYKITTQVTIEVFTYQDADEEIPDYHCYQSLQEFKEGMLTHLSAVAERVDKLTLKEIKKGVTL